MEAMLRSKGLEGVYGPLMGHLSMCVPVFLAATPVNSGRHERQKKVSNGSRSVGDRVRSCGRRGGIRALLWEQGVPGSNPGAPIRRKMKPLNDLGCWGALSMDIGWVSSHP